MLLSAAERDAFYLGFSNEIIWPLFHDLQTRCHFNPAYWSVYEQVNRTFARAAEAHLNTPGYIWVQDYHLMHVGQELRERGVTTPIGFFLHIPFPPLDIFLKLPWRTQILQALLAYDLIGFQTARDRRNFVQCVRTLLRDVTVRGKGQVISARTGDRDIRLGYFPISIDSRALARRAGSAEVTEHIQQLRAAMPDRQLILGVDRLDYTKGIPEKLEAYRTALARYPDLHGKLTLTQVVVPSRTDIPAYADLKAEIEQLVGEINGQFTQYGWVPIQYFFRSLSQVELLAYYRLADIALITPLKDGMNLVAKEYCASSLDDGVVILSEFAGAAAQMHRGALLVNPHDVNGTADAIYRAWTMPQHERRVRLTTLRRSVRDYDIFWWVDAFMRAGTARHLDEFSFVEEAIPRERMI
jgi:trehalose 6-phosphate synthase